MAASARKPSTSKPLRSPDDTDFHAHLAQAASQYEQLRTQAEQDAARVLRLQAQLAETEATNRHLQERVHAADEEATRQRDATQRQQERNQALAEALKEINRALFRGDVYALILRTCLALTHATRGLYLVSSGVGAPVQIRAAISVDGYPEAPPSDFLQALCDHVLAQQDSLIFDLPEELEKVATPEKPAEEFSNGIAAPVVLLQNLNGVVLVADKESGTFDEEDVETLLSVGDQAGVVMENVQLQQALQAAYISIVSVLADAAEAKDAYTRGHCDITAHLARLTAEQMGLSEDEQGLVCYSALLHDIGKIGISDGVLNKPGPLLPAERDLVRSHVEIGYHLLSQVPTFDRVAEVVRHHHEWYDGTGYPEGLKGQKIPRASRVVAVVDAFNAMTSQRSYKPAYSVEHSRKELIDCKSSQFDPEVVDAFLTVLARPDALVVDSASFRLPLPLFATSPLAKQKPPRPAKD